MSTLLMIFTTLLILSGLLYSILILSYTYGWYRLKSFQPATSGSIKTFASVIIPARNESQNIVNILDDLYNQSLLKHNFEVIIIDDHSTDETADLVRGFMNSFADMDIKMITLSADHKTNAFKKKAIREAIQKSKGELIVTTDADCRVGVRWLETLLQFYEKEKPRMIVGPVSFHNEDSVFEKMQTEEFLSLIAITGGAIQINKPIMCNGANLAYEKNAFYNAGGFGDDRFSSGDDVFLMLNIRKMFGNRSIHFLKNYDAIVHTEAKKNITDFVQQRTRWASKNKGYEFNILFVSFTVYVVNLLVAAGLLTSIFIPAIFPAILTFLLIKILIDLPILIGIDKFVKRTGFALYLFPLVILYPFYIVFVGALGILGNYQWKGRKVRN